MIKNTIFILTHLESGWEKLVEKLNSHPRIQIFNTGNSYSHPDDVVRLRQQPHKQGGAAAVWGDLVFHNKDFLMKRICQHYKLLFWSKPFEQCSVALANEFPNSEHAAIYYQSRLWGMQIYWDRQFRAYQKCNYDAVKKPLWNPSLDGEDLFAAIL